MATPGQKLTPRQVEELARVWTETANASEAARRVGCSTATAIRHLRRAGVPKAETLYAQALEQEEQRHLAAVRKARRKVSKALDMAGTDSEAVSELARAANDSLRAVAATRAAHLKLAGLSAPDRHDVTSAGAPLATIVLLPPLDDDGAASPLETERRPADSLPGEPRE